MSAARQHGPAAHLLRESAGSAHAKLLGIGVWFKLGFFLLSSVSVSGEILWSDLGARVIHNTVPGSDLLGGVAKRDDTASDALYFKFRVDPLTDIASEPYSAGFQLFEGDAPRLAVGNAPEAWGYSAYNASETSTIEGAKGEFDLKSSQPEAEGMGKFKPYELPRHDHERTIVFKVQFVPGGDDLITVWLDPDLTHGATEQSQAENLTTRFKANASFDQIRLRHEGGGNGWVFSDMEIATGFSDFVVTRFWQTWWFMGTTAVVLLAAVAGAVRIVERRKYQRRLLLAEQERVIERERARIAQDLHDELGSSLARISLLSNLVKMDKDRPDEVENHADKLAQSADQTVRALEEIVWAVRSDSDSLQGLMDYIAHFADEMSEEKATRCRLDLPPDLPSRPLPPDVRHNIFLVVKEAITNAIKHAGAKEVLVRAQMRADSLEIEVADNGIGFNPDHVARTTNRNGLVNMKQRAQAIGAQLKIRSHPGRGSSIQLTSRLPSIDQHA